MKTKTKRPRIIKPVIQTKPDNPGFKSLPKADNTEKVSEPIIPDIQDELVAVPVNPDAVSSCVGCYFYDESEKCNDTEGHDCTGVIFIKE